MTPRRTPPPPAPELYRFNALDYAAVGLYAGIAVLFMVAGTFILPLLLELAPTPASATYALNFIFTGLVGTIAFLAARKVLIRDLKVLATRPWFTLIMVPTAVVAMMVLTALAVAAGGEVQTSANQEVLQKLVQQVPAWLMIPLLVVVGPFVEEYVFRHLLIGKLSRHINVWVCSFLSVVLFAAMHIVGREEVTLPALLPYLAMGTALVLVYLWTGRNVMFSYFVHAAKNLLAAVMLYAISPEVLEQLQQVQP